jgi:hypothetical protein
LKIHERVYGFTAMTQQMGGESRSTIAMKLHGLLGRYQTQDATFSPGIQDVYGDTLHTTLPVSSQIGSAFVTATTGDSHSLPDGGMVIVVGRPQFRDKDLSSQASIQGVAAALARGYLNYSQEIFSQLFGSFSCAIIDTSTQRVLLPSTAWASNRCTTMSMHQV